MFFMSIPRIGDDEVKRRYSKIRPVVTVDGKLYYLREYSVRELRETSYYENREKDIISCVREDELEIWEGHDFTCLHSYGYPEVFKPCAGEILAQLSQFDLGRVRAFEIIEAPETKEDFHKTNFHTTAFNNGFHVSTVRLYIPKQKN